VFSRDARKVVDIESYKKNPLEKLANKILYPTVDLPRQLPTYKDNPIVITMIATKVAMFSLKLLAYPKSTVAGMISKIGYLPRIAYLLVQLSLIGLACRSVGRMTNPDLMKAFDAKEQKADEVLPVNSEQVSTDLLKPLMKPDQTPPVNYSRLKAENFSMNRDGSCNLSEVSSVQKNS
jgi:hypothetical protein